MDELQSHGSKENPHIIPTGMFADDKRYISLCDGVQR